MASNNELMANEGFVLANKKIYVSEYNRDDKTIIKTIIKRIIA